MSIQEKKNSLIIKFSNYEINNSGIINIAVTGDYSVYINIVFKD